MNNLPDASNADQELLQRAKSDLGAVNHFISLTDEHKLRLSEKLLGHNLIQDALCLPEIFQCLSHSHHSFRTAALLYVLSTTNAMLLSNNDLIDNCMRIVMNDPEQSVRGLAWNILLLAPKRIQRKYISDVVLKLLGENRITSSEVIHAQKTNDLKEIVRQVEKEQALLHQESQKCCEETIYEICEDMKFKAKEMIDDYHRATVMLRNYFKNHYP